MSRMICINVEEYEQERKALEQSGIEKGYLHCLSLIKAIIDGEEIQFSEGTPDEQKDLWLKFINAVRSKCECKCKEESVPVAGE